LGLKQINTNTCLYTNDKVVIMVFVNNILILYQPEHCCYADDLIRQMQAKYKFCDLGKGGSFLNIKITRDQSKWKLWLSQQAYINKIVARYHLEATGRKPSTPLDGKILRPYNGTASMVEIHHYQSKVRSTIYPAVITQLDIAKIVSKLARYLTNPGPEHFNTIN
jgi:hypothetical protein